MGARGVDNNGTLEGYELHVPHTVEVVPLGSARQDAYGKLAGSSKEDDYQKFHDTMDMQMVLLKPGGADAQGKGHQHQISTAAANPGQGAAWNTGVRGEGRAHRQVEAAHVSLVRLGADQG